MPIVHQGLDPVYTDKMDDGADINNGLNTFSY